MLLPKPARWLVARFRLATWNLATDSSLETAAGSTSTGACLPPPAAERRSRRTRSVSGSTASTCPSWPATAAAAKLNRPRLAPMSHTVSPGRTTSATSRSSSGSTPAIGRARYRNPPSVET